MQRFSSPTGRAHAAPRPHRSRAGARRLGITTLASLLLEATATAQPAPRADAPSGDGDATRTSPGTASEPATAPPVTDQVTGKVVDTLGAPVAGARVRVDGGTGQATAQATTDRAGRFVLAAPPGASLVIERDGYDPAFATASGPAIDDVVVVPEGTATETIEVHGEAPAAAPGAASLDRSELQRIPGTGGDFVRALTAMPGVVNLQIPLGNTGVVIRGSSPQDSKILVDGFEVPEVFHNVGLRAVLPAEAIESLDYIPGGFDTSFGRATSGIIKLTTRPGSAERTEQAEVSLLDGGLLVQGSIGAATRYMFGLRRSTLDLVLPSLIPSDADLSLTTLPRYYDGQLRVDHDLSARWHLMFSALGADDVLELFASKQTGPDADAKRFYDRTRFIRTTATASYHDGPWFATLALSGMLPQIEAINGLYQHIRFTYPMVTPRVELGRSADSFAGLTHVVWQAGAETQITRADADIAIGNEPREGEPPPAMDPKDTSTTFKGVVWMPDVAAWTSLAASVTSRIRATAGVRTDEYGRSGEVVVEPRGELQIALPGALTARLSGGLYTRPPEYQSEILTKTLHAERSAQAIAGLGWEPIDGARIQTSVYATDRDHLITRNADGSLGNDGAGTTMGAELLATYRTSHWFTWLSYAYSHSTRTDHPGLASRLFDFDQPHSLNAAASWQSGRWQLGGRFQLYSGLPFTPAIGASLDSDKNVYAPIYGPINSERAPIHHQLDVRIDYSWRWGAAAMTAFLDVQNVYLDQSTVTYFYNYDYSQREAFKSLPLLPSIGLRAVL